MTELVNDSKKGIAAVCAATYPPELGGAVADDCPIRPLRNMKTFVARSGRLLLLTAALASAPLALMRGESETPGVAATANTPTVESSGGNDVGLGIFSRFPVNISAFVQGGYDDNIFTSNAIEQGSGFVSGGIALAYELGESQRTTLTLSSQFGFTYYTELDTDPFEPNINLAVKVSHKATPRLTMTFSGVFAYQNEPDFQYGFGTNRRSGNYFFTQDTFGLNYAWAPRFATASSYSIVAVQYDNMAAGFFEDRLEHTFGNEFRFLVWPTTNLVGEYRFQVVSYEHADRDSTTHYLLGGFDHAFTPRLTAAFRGGAQVRHYENFDDQDSPYFQGNVNYRLGKDTSIGWNFHYGIEEGDVATNTNRKSFRTGLQGKRDITARISASIAMYYYHDNYAESTFATPGGGPPITNPSFSEDSFAIDLGLRYAVTRYLGVDLGYNHNQVSSDAAGTIRDYSRNRVYGGINFAF